MEFIITTSSGVIIMSNIWNPLKLAQLLQCKTETETLTCSVSKLVIRNGFIKSWNYNLFLSCNNQNTTNKMFKHYLTCFKELSYQIVSLIDSNKEKENQNTRRLKHNLINHNANILQELYRLFPQENFKGESNHLDIIENAVSKDLHKTASAFLRILKNSNLMKAEFDVYEILWKENPDLDFIDHQIHKIVLLSLQPFWLDLIQNRIHILIEPFPNKIKIDYKTLSVAFAHIYDNATKYLLHGSDLKINFKDSSDEIKIIFDMISLKICPDELDDIFCENISGKFSKKHWLAWNWIWMFMISKLITLNNWNISLRINMDESKCRVINGIPYENNILEIIFKK